MVLLMDTIVHVFGFLSLYLILFKLDGSDTTENTAEKVNFSWFQSVERQYELLFDVRTCSEARFILVQELFTSIVYQNDFYDITIGGSQNTLSCINIYNYLFGIKSTVQHYCQHTSKLLHCKEKRAFWITWRCGNIVVGTGETIGENAVMKLTATNIYRSIISAYFINDSNVEWRVRYHSGCSCSCSDGCNETNGDCICREGWTGRSCDECKDGYGSIKCQKCSIGCKSVCAKDTSKCTCKRGWGGDRCDFCSYGFYGKLCNQRCSIGCRDICNKTNGKCTCKNGWEGSTCDDIVSTTTATSETCNSTSNLTETAMSGAPSGEELARQSLMVAIGVIAVIQILEASQFGLV